MATGRKPDFKKKKKKQEDHHVLYRQVRSSRRGRSAESYSIYQARPRQGNPVPDTDVDATMLYIAGTLL